MNERIISYIRTKIKNNGMTFKFISKATEIPYGRLMRILNQNAEISGSEMIALCIELKIEQKELYKLVEK